jgi:hypothetical protein
VVLLDAMPVAGTGCDHADAAHVRGLIEESPRDPEPARRTTSPNASASDG